MFEFLGTNWTTFAIACGVYAVIVVSSFLIADKARKGSLIYLIYFLIALLGFIASLLMRLFWSINVFWNDLFEDLAIFLFLAAILEIIYMVRTKKQEKRYQDWYKENIEDPEYEKMLKDMEQEMNDPNRPHAHD